VSYKLPEPLQSRVREFAGENPSDLEMEIALARALCEFSAHQGRVSDTIQLLRVISNLSAANQENLVRQGKMLERDAALQLGRRFVEIVMDKLEAIPGHEALCDEILVEFDKLKTPEPTYEPKRLTDQRSV